MKLLTRISLNFLSISLFIFLLGIIVFYYVLRQQMDEHINNELDRRMNSLLVQMSTATDSIPFGEDLEQRIELTPSSKAIQAETIYSDTILFSAAQDKYVVARKLQFSSMHLGRMHRVTIYKPLGETDSLIARLLLLLTVLVILLIGGLLFLHRHTSQKAWKDFYKTIQKINKYDLNAHEEFKLETSDIKEFNDLNTVLNSMSERIENDFLQLKEYTENASHEIQTPLAVIISKMELLLQSPNLNEKELKTIADAYEASSKLSRLNATLLLLTKIGNNQFPNTEPIETKEIIISQLDNLEEIIQTKGIQVTLPEKGQTIKMNRYLAEIMLANLIKNAVRHNIAGGSIIISLTPDQIAISNTGKEIAADSTKIFDRFYRSSKSQKSMGLGLAIVQKICKVSGFSINYSYHDNSHHFSILLPFKQSED